MSNALQVYSGDNFSTMMQVSKQLADSGFFTDAKQASQAMVKVMAGAEMGLPPFASMTGIHIIKGKPSLGSNMIATLIKNSGRYNYRVVAHSDAICTIKFFENDEPCGESSFTIEDAKKAQLLSNPTWQKFPKNMLFSRAMSNGAKWYCADVFGGSPVYTPDELGADVDGDGNVVEGAFVVEKPEPELGLPSQQTPSDKILNSEASEFWAIALNAIPRYDHINAVKATAKKLGYTALSGVPAERVKMFESIRDYAEMRDKGMPDQLAISVINGVITTKEAWEQVAREGASPADVEAINKDLFGDDTDTTPAGNNYDE